MDVVIVFACLAVPTVLLESSSAVWGPGTRWPMIYQVTTPVVMLGIVAALLLASRSPYRAWLWSGGVGVAVAIGALFSLGQNWDQNTIASNERFIRDSIERLIAADAVAGRKPTQVLLMLDEPNRRFWRSSDVLSPIIARVWLRGLDISFRIVPWMPSPEASWQSWWRVRFGPDAEGLGNAKVWGGTVPYQQIAVLRISGRNARRLTRIDRDDLANWDVEWARDGPVNLPGPTPGELCPLKWSANEDALLSGWGDAESDSKGPVRWTLAHAAQLILPLTCDDGAVMRVTAAYAVSMRNIDGLRLTVNGETLPYRRRASDGDIIYEADLGASMMARSPSLRIGFEESELERVPGANRRFGIAIRAVEILPSGQGL